MAEALLPFAVERLWNLLVRETGRFQGVEEQFEGLKSDVKKLRCFLEDADAKKHKSATVKRTIQAVKEIVLDAEDIVETFVLMEELGNRRGITNTVRRLSCVSLERRGLAMDMKAVRERISKEIHDMQSFGVQQQVIVRERCMPPQDEQRQTFYIVDEEQRIVGMERNIELVVGNLVEEDSRQVFAITGMGGGLAWVCVSQQFEKKTIWQTILQQLWPECDVSKMMEGELLERIVRVLYTQKALIIIDDIWREGDWDLIKHVFLPKKGWKVLLTSRNEEVALHADKHCVTFKPECLTFEESWDLFQRIAFPIKDTAEFKIEEDMKEIGMEMLKHCGGLPLAIKVLGGLLELPVYLKHCFLYLAHFPEDYELSVENLSYYWAAERLPRPRYYDGASIREVADGYIEELVKRNMVISKRDVDTSRFETLQLHDMMREVCLLKAEEENFVQTIGTSTANSISPCKSRRLFVVNWDAEIFNLDKEVKNPSLRTLLFLKTKTQIIPLLFTRHKLMRVLDLSYVDFKGWKVPSSIGKFIHLRYLSLEGSYVTQLPSSMWNLKKLIYLNLDVYSEVYMPNNILKEMRELTFLWLPRRLHDKTKLELGNLVKLETLKNFNTKHGRVTDLQGMTRLRSLSIFITDERYTMETLSSSLSKLSHLESLTIDNDNEFYTPTNDDEEGFVWDFVNLKQLRLEISMPSEHLLQRIVYVLLLEDGVTTDYIEAPKEQNLVRSRINIILLEMQQLAFDLCLVLSKRGHDPIWDLGARGLALEHIDVRVRHMIMKPVEDIYPKWDNDKIYTDLDNMIKDILNGQLNEKFWDAVPTTKCQKRKNGVAASVVPNQRPSTMRRKDKEPADGGEASNMAAEHKVAISGLAELVKILTAKMEGIVDSVADKVTKALEATIDSKVEARVRAYESDLRNQIAKLEAQINDSKNNADVNIAPDVATSKAYEDEEDDACSNDLKKINSQDGLPVDCVVKKEKKDKKTMDSTQNLTTEVVIKTEKKAGIPLRRVKQEKAFEIPQLNDESISSKDLENHLQWEKSVNCRAVLEALASNLKEPTRRRKPQLTKTQIWPFVGNSTVKRIINGEKVSKEPYDPLAKVEAEKLQKVLDFIKSDLEEKEAGVGDESAGFFLKLLIPRDDWPTKDYGTLQQQCLCFTDGPGKNSLRIPLLELHFCLTGL
ncbi:hypothetical protein HID58_049676 [Brassica napus]|uniref:Disease resistance protein n=1 Tax=Brassica napus TaxID=3708 RepID=A0ABQ8B5W3_BRANA|nr:hypothetical protein HID58_049676 [Brassica napus]